MSTGMLSMRTWSATGLTKSALLIHGNREVGDAWYKVAEGLVKEGYSVHAPDLMNNGFSSPSPPGKYMLPDQAQFLYDHLPSNHYDLLAGVSMGGLITFEYYKLLSPDQQPKRMVLLEPSLDLKLPPQIVTKIRESADSPKEEGVIAKENPGWEATDNVVDRLGLVRTNKEVFQQIFQGTGPPLVPHSDLPDASPNTEMILLSGERGMYKKDREGVILQREKPHFKLGEVSGAGHYIHKDQSGAVVDALLGRMEESSFITVVKAPRSEL